MAMKRGSGEASKHPTKKAKTTAAEEPLLNFLGACGDLPKTCREMLQVGLPRCLEVAEPERHRYHIVVLDHVAALLASAQEEKQEAVRSVDNELSEIQVEKGKAAAEVTSAKGQVVSQQGELHTKGKKLVEVRKACEVAPHALAAALERKEACNRTKLGALADQDKFKRFLTDVWQPLKEDGVSGAKRNKLMAELQAKLTELGARHLCDSMECLLKMTNGSFAKSAVESASDCFKKHAVRLSHVISGLDEEEAVHKAAIAAAEGAIVEEKARLEALTRERDEMQLEKARLEKVTAEAVKDHQGMQARIPPALKRLAKAREDLETFLQLPALFSRLKELSTAVPEEPTTPNKANKREKTRNLPTPLRRHSSEIDGMARGASSTWSIPAVSAADVSLARDQQAACEVKRIELHRRDAFISDDAWGLAVLNVSIRDVAAVQRSYRVLMAKLHPDRVKHTVGIARALDRLKEAKEVCERSLSKKFAPGIPRKLSSTALCTVPGRRRYQLQWQAPRDSPSAPVHRFVVAVLDPVLGPLKIAILEPDYDQELCRFVTVNELGSYTLAEEELRKIKSLWRQSVATVQIAAANDAGQSDWAVVRVTLSK